MTELGEQGRPDGGTLRYAVEENTGRAASVGDDSHSQSGACEVNEVLVDVRPDGVEQVCLRISDTPVKTAHPWQVVGGVVGPQHVGVLPQLRRCRAGAP